MAEWRRRLNRLPVLLHYPGSRMSLRNDECIKGDLKHAHYIGTREYLPTMGVKYVISTFGAQKGREHILGQLIEELGQPEVDNRTGSRHWFFFWPSDSQEIPKTKVHEVLGDERLNEIMDDFGLSDEERKIVNVSLAMFAFTTGMEWQRRKNYIFAALAEAQPERIGAITQATLVITTEFGIRRQQQMREKRTEKSRRGSTPVRGDDHLH